MTVAQGVVSASSRLKTRGKSILNELPVACSTWKPAVKGVMWTGIGVFQGVYAHGPYKLVPVVAPKLHLPPA